MGEVDRCSVRVIPVAVSCWVSPEGRFVANGETDIETSTAGSTVIAAVPSTDVVGSVAVIVAAPVPFAVTRPEDETVAVDSGRSRPGHIGRDVGAGAIRIEARGHQLLGLAHGNVGKNGGNRDREQHRR